MSLKLDIIYDGDSAQIQDTGNPKWRIVRNEGYTQVLELVVNSPAEDQAGEIALMLPMLEDGNGYTVMMSLWGWYAPIVITDDITYDDDGRVVLVNLNRHLNEALNVLEILVGKTTSE